MKVPYVCGVMHSTAIFYGGPEIINVGTHLLFYFLFQANVSKLTYPSRCLSSALHSTFFPFQKYVKVLVPKTQ